MNSPATDTPASQAAPQGSADDRIIAIWLLAVDLLRQIIRVRSTRRQGPDTTHP
jgi:hypothetical protein